MSQADPRDEALPILPAQPRVASSWVEDESERAFGRYRLLVRLAHGGMATVYLARAVGPGGFEKPVAIKTIRADLAGNRRLKQMFLDEARISAQIVHPNVCSVFDFGEEGGSYFIAMEYLAGEPLSSVLEAVAGNERLLASRRWQAIAARIIADACEGLHSAHELRDATGRPLSVVHRDVSPQNIFLTYDGAVKVLDFGVAWAMNRLHETTAGKVRGKRGYLAPEQLAGSVVDRRADVWALGVCLWEMLCGRHLFVRKNEVRTFEAINAARVPPPSSVRPEVAPLLDEVVLRALSREPEARFPTARAMGRALHDVLRSASESIGLADLAELMSELYPDELTEKSELVAKVLSTGGPAPKPAAAPAAEPTTQTESTTVPWQKPGRRRLLPLFIAIALVVAAAIGVAAGLLVD